MGYVTRRSRARYQVGGLTANYRLITTGAARVAPGRFRYRGLFASAERLARRDDRGIFGTLCNGSLAPPKPPKPPKRPIVQPEPVRPQPSTGTGRVRSDAYNCDDFPLSDGTTAQQYLNRFPDDPSGLDGDGDGVACE